MPKAPRPANERSKEPQPQKKRVYDVIPDGVPEAAAFLVLDKGFSVAYAAKIMHVKRNALSKHIQKFRDARQRARTKRREGNAANADNVSSEQDGAAAAQPEAATSDLPAAQDGAAAHPIAASSDLSAHQAASAQLIAPTSDLPPAQDGAAAQSIAAASSASAQLAAVTQLQAASGASAQGAVVVAQAEAAVSDSSEQVAVAAQPIVAVTSTSPAPEAALTQLQPAAVRVPIASTGVSVAECTCCARCQEQKKKFQEGVVI